MSRGLRAFAHISGVGVGGIGGDGDARRRVNGHDRASR